MEYGLKRSLRPVWGGEATRHVPVSASSVPTASVRMSTHKGILDHHHSAGHRPASAVPTIAIPRSRCVTHGPWPDSASCDTQLTHLMAVGSPQRPLSGARQTKQTMRSFYGGARGVKSGCGNAWEDVGRRGHSGKIVAARLPRLCRTRRHLPGQGRRHLAPTAVQGNGSLRRIACQSCTGRGPFSYTCECSVDRQKRACARVRFKKILYCTLSQKSCGGEFAKKDKSGI